MLRRKVDGMLADGHANLPKPPRSERAKRVHLAGSGRFHAFLDVANDPQRSWDALREKRGAAATETLRKSVDAARRRVPGADARLLDGPPTVERMSLEGADWPRGKHGRSGVITAPGRSRARARPRLGVQPARAGRAANTRRAIASPSVVTASRRELAVAGAFLERNVASYRPLTDRRAARSDRRPSSRAFDKRPASSGPIRVHARSCIVQGRPHAWWGRRERAIWTRSACLIYLLGGDVSANNILEHLDVAMLTVDETVDDGIILEVDSKTIVNRVLMQGADGSVKDITDMTISQAMEVAREQLLKNVV